VTPRVVLVTGASSGIGRATAHQLSRARDSVILLSRSEAALTVAASECLAAGAASADVVVADVGDDDALRRAVADVLELHGRLDVVVHAAGVVAYGRVEDVPADVFERVHRTNLLGSVNVARHVIPVLREQGSGTLVLVGSLLGSIVAPGMSAYVTTKWGVRALARQLQIENRDVPAVSVCHVTPGSVNTPIYRQAANYLGAAGGPPPPVDAPEKVAKAIVRTLERPRAHVNVGISNTMTVFGFTVLPRLFDALVGPLFALAAMERRQPASGPGNVLSPRPQLEGVHGEHGRRVRDMLLRRHGAGGTG
jgi:NAD(P)-dependent dehydrogenase (short-subunit alcohol dehydrogenase family)